MTIRAKLNILAVIGMVLTAFVATALLVHDLISSAPSPGQDAPNRGVMSQVIKSD